MDIVIYGAQGYALGAYEAITTLYPEKRVVCFLVSERGINADSLAGIPVREIDSFSAGMSDGEKKILQVIIATPEDVQPEIEKTLEKNGFCNYLELDAKKYEQLMREYHTVKGRFLPLLENNIGGNISFARIYMAKHENDKNLMGKFVLPKCIIPIQVGAENANTRISDVTDNLGENISHKNGNYSELTALYWIWKNMLEGGKEQYYGLYQYRRILMLTEDDIVGLRDNEVDVVLPYPLVYDPDINAHHERYIKEDDWKALLQALSELSPEYADALTEVLKQRYLYNYNIIVARRKVLCDYCAWLFPILERIEELSVPKSSERADRYIGYMAETLETLYFMKNKDNRIIRHVGCKMLV